jgi:TRAP-type C4-dicarboxylate transport system substrate-binding protein
MNLITEEGNKMHAQESMKRMIIIVVASIFMLGLTSSISQAAEKVVVIKLASVVAPTAPMWRGVEKWANLVEERIGDKVKIQRYPAGQLYRDAESEYRALSKGVIQAGGLFGTLVGGVKPGLDWQSIPGACDAKNYPELNRKTMPIIEKYLAQDNLKFLGPSYQGSALSCTFSTKRNIKSFEDFKGLKVYSHSKWQMKIAEHFGGAGIEMPTSEVYTALDRGLVDVGWSAYAGGPQAFKWNEVAKYMTGPIPGGIAGYYIVVNMKTWKSLPADAQKVMAKAAEDAALWCNDWAQKNDLEQQKIIKEKYPETYYQIPEQQVAEMEKFAGDLLWPIYVKESKIGPEIKRLISKK